MKELILHPLSISLGFKFAKPMPMEQVKGLIGEMFDALAQAVSRREGCIIGHIKGLAMLEREDWLKVSVISAARPSQAEASGNSPVESMSMAVNFMVYGLEPDQLFQLATEVVGQAGKPWSDSVTLERPTRLTTLEHHDHDHHGDGHQHHKQ